jgi:membrane-associated phospholipid phosphatase
MGTRCQARRTIPGVGVARVESLPASEETPAASSRAEKSLGRTVVLIWGTVLVFGVITLLWSAHVDVPMRDPHGKMFARKLLGAVVLFAVLAVVDVAIRWWRTGHTRAALIAVVRRRLAPRRLALVLAGLVAYHLIYICYRNLKSWDAFQAPHDAWMLAFDKAVLFGHSPAVLLHDLLGEHAAAYPLAFAYQIFTYVCTAAVVGSLAFLDSMRKAHVMLVAAMWTWILGTASYYLIPTLGPVFSVPQEFAGLPHTSVTSMVIDDAKDRAFFLADPQNPKAFVGVSAFASLHVGFTTTVLLMAVYLRKRLLAWLLALYLLVVMVATLYFGWHFLLDLVGGLALAAASVLIGHLTVYRRMPRWTSSRSPRRAAN